MKSVSFYNCRPKVFRSIYINFESLEMYHRKSFGRPFGCISFHPHEEFLIMDLTLRHPDKTVPELLEELLLETGSVHPCSSLVYYLK